MCATMGTPGGAFFLLLVLIAARISAVQFPCGGTTCPAGMDCIERGGKTTCADPCDSYTDLRDDWRSTQFSTQSSKWRCDKRVEWKGWCRLFLEDKSAHIPETCGVESYKCGTSGPVTMVEPHPTQLGEIVIRDVCRCYGGKCYPSDRHSIHVKLCSTTVSTYYVYKLVKPSICDRAYCAEQLELDPPLISLLDCGADKIQVGVDSAKMRLIGRDPLIGNLIDSTCSQAREKDGVVWYEVGAQEGACRNTLKTNGTHVTYSNTLFIYPANSSSVLPASLPFSCEYPLKTDARLNVVIRPTVVTDEEVVQPRVPDEPPSQSGAAEGVPPRRVDNVFVGSGAKLGTSMVLFKNSFKNSFDAKTYAAGTVVLPVGSALYVGVSVRDPRLAVVLEDCFASHSSDTKSPGQHHLIQNKSPTNRQQVFVVESGASHQARFSALLFFLQGKHQDVYLHCSLSLCDRKTTSCSPKLDPSLSNLNCGSDKIQVGVDLASTRPTGYSALTGNLADGKCSWTRDKHGVVWYDADAQTGACGNTLTINSTHVIYSNALFIYPDSCTSFFLPLVLPFSCAYPLDTPTRLKAPIRLNLPPSKEVDRNQVPDDPSSQSGAVNEDPPSRMEGVFVGSGAKLKASMVLFKKSDYAEPYAAGAVVLPVGSPLYVEVSVDKKDPSLAVVLEECFTSYSSDPDHLERNLLIQNKCPTDRQRVSVVMSGSSLKARFITSFILVGESGDVYLHCSLSLCDSMTSSCIPSCSGRARRHVFKSSPLKPLTIGPITWEKSSE
ncbi:uromodulin-like [Dunckerocampus dactyliophorus]|uniref:uromodulin-like n=1 Tax=Dunckerocampus dactyliophorus TaxID=161453 RepID=UPI00240722BE|nr:uromodulin-like [Dunckerocampus dactyliophorus]